MDNIIFIKFSLYNNIIITTKTKKYKNRCVTYVEMMSIVEFRKYNIEKIYIKKFKKIKRKYKYDEEDD